MQPKRNKLAYRFPSKPWETMGINILTLNNMNYICIVDYHSKSIDLRAYEPITLQKFKIVSSFTKV